MKLLPFLLFFTIISFGQTKTELDQKADSVVYYLENAKGSFTIKYLNRAVEISRQIKNDSLLRESLISLGLTYYRKEDTTKLKEVREDLKSLYIRSKDSLSLAKVYHFKALSFKIKYQLDSSYYYYHESKNISILLKDSLEVGRRLLSMADMQKNEGDFIGGEVTIVEGLRYLEPLENFWHKPHSMVTLGNILTDFGRYEEAREYYKKAGELYKQNPSKKRREGELLNVLNNIGNTYLLQSNPKKAIEYLQKGLEKDSVKENYLWHYKRLLGNIADCKYMLGKKEEALDDLKKLLTIRQRSKDVYGQSLSHNGLAYYSQLENNNQKALFHAEKGYHLAKEVNNNATILSALLKLGELTYGNESKRYYKEYASLNDSLNNRERYFKDQFAKVRYETEKKDKANATLKLEAEQERRQKESEKQQKIIFSLIGVLGIILIVVYSSNRRKKLMYEAQLQKASAREEERVRERNRISQELHDGVLSRLFGTRVSLGFLEFQEDKETKQQHELLLKELQDIEKEIRDVSHQLNSHFDISNTSFTTILQKLLESKESLGNFELQFEKGDVSWKNIDEFVKISLYRIVQEALQNIVKHAEAKKVFLSFSKQKKSICIRIEDDGVGFVTKASTEGIGIKNIYSRVQKLKGNIEILSEPNKGTSIQIEIPIE